MQHTLVNFAETAESGGVLGFSPQAFVIQLITFALVFLFLRRYAFKPILKVLEERRSVIEQGVKLGEEMQREKAELDAKITKQLTDARKEADGIVASAHSEAKDTVREAEEKARDKADNIVADAQTRIASETARARKKLESEVVELISDATEAIVGEKLDPVKDRALIDKALKGKA